MPKNAGMGKVFDESMADLGNYLAIRNHQKANNAL
jgi:hypothetical protein